jgi:uncharacterized membrane protein
MIAAVVALILVLAFKREGDELGWVDSASIVVAVLVVSFVKAVTDWTQQHAFTVTNRMKNSKLTSIVRNGDRVRRSRFHDEETNGMYRRHL